MLRLSEAILKLPMLWLSEADFEAANSGIRLGKLPATNLQGWSVVASERRNIGSL